MKVLIEGERRGAGGRTVKFGGWGWRHAIPQKGNHRCASENQGQRGIKHPPRGIRELPRLRRKSRKARESEWFVEWEGRGLKKRKP